MPTKQKTNHYETIFLYSALLLFGIAIIVIINLVFADAMGSMFAKPTILLLISYAVATLAFYPRLSRIKYQLTVLCFIGVAVFFLPSAPWRWQHHDTWLIIYKSLLVLFILTAVYEARHLSVKTNRTLYRYYIVICSILAGMLYF